MKNKYIDFIEQNFVFPQPEFSLNENRLQFHSIDLMNLVQKYGTPFKFSFLPKISENITLARKWFSDAMEKHEYQAKYNYCYCTKSSHFKFIMDEALKNPIHIETSSAFDIDIIYSLIKEGKITKDRYIVCNGYKMDDYLHHIAQLIKMGYENCIPIIDNSNELNHLAESINQPFKLGMRIASEEDPTFEFYTSRLGIGYRDIVPFYKREIATKPHIELKMLHFFINTGIRDTAYYWNELLKCVNVYIELKKVCPTLDSLNIGGGLPIKNSLNFNYDYAYIIDLIVEQIKKACDEAGVPVPHLFTEFGTFTVGESGGVVYEVLYQKQQNDREKWNMINSSFITTLPDTWAIDKRFLMLPLNRWNEEYERCFLGGLTCDSDDYYNSQEDSNAIYLPKYNKNNPLYIGFFNTGAYQETIGGYGGLQHCLIPTPKHIVITEDEQGNLKDYLFALEQKAEQVLRILGY